MAIMTGVQSAQVLGPSTQKQANKSREAIQEVDDDASFDASENFENAGGAGANSAGYGETDGGRSTKEKNNGLDVVRTSE
jgi:cell division protein FtsZ